MDEIQKDFAGRITSMIMATCEETLSHVKALPREKMGSDPLPDNEQDPLLGAARSDYRTTPGSIQQSLAGWVAAASRALIDTQRKYLRSPSVEAEARLMLASAIYCRTVGDGAWRVPPQVVAAIELRSAAQAREQQDPFGR